MGNVISTVLIFSGSEERIAEIDKYLSSEEVTRMQDLLDCFGYPEEKIDELWGQRSLFIHRELLAPTRLLIETEDSNSPHRELIVAYPEALGVDVEYSFFDFGNDYYSGSEGFLNLLPDQKVMAIVDNSKMIEKILGDVPALEEGAFSTINIGMFPSKEAVTKKAGLTVGKLKKKGVRLLEFEVEDPNDFI